MELLKNMGRKTSIVTNELAKPEINKSKQMSSADDIASWYEGVQLYDYGDVDQALEIFKNTKQNAKMLLNIGCCYLRKNDLKSATENYEKAVKSDPHSALGFFFLGLVNYFQDKYAEALSSFQKSQKLLRGNKCVDYRQLGFKFQLYACEILTNVAGTYLRLNDLAKAQEAIQQAYEQKVDKKHERIINDVDRLKSIRPKIDLFYPPKSEVFRPSKALVANVKKKDYLGAAKVISTDSEEDCYACFSGIKDKVIEQKNEEKRRKSSVVPPTGLDQTDGDKKRRLTPSATFDASSGSRKSSLTPSSRQASFESNASISPAGTPQRRRSSTKPMPLAPLPDCPGIPHESSGDSSRKLSQTEGFIQRDSLSRERKSSTVKPFKPLPKLSREEAVVENVSIPQLETQPPTPQIDFEVEGPFPVSTASVTQLETQRSKPQIDFETPVSTNATNDEVEVTLKYCFTRKVRLSNRFTMDDLQAQVCSQQLPTNFEFRTEDNIGRQNTLNIQSLNSISQGTIILCYPSE